MGNGAQFHQRAAIPGVQNGSPDNSGRRPRTSASGSQEPRNGDALRKVAPKRRGVMRVTVVPIPVEMYPAFQTDPDHPFIALSPEKRIAEIDACCSALWARICAERAARRPETIQPAAAKSVAA